MESFEFFESLESFETRDFCYFYELFENKQNLELFENVYSDLFEKNKINNMFYESFENTNLIF